MRDSNGRFLPGNTFAAGYGVPPSNRNAKGHGAPLGNQNAKDHGAPSRNINAVKTGEFMQFEEGETPYERLRGGESELQVWCVNAGHLLMRVRCDLIEERQRLKAASSNREERF